MNWSAVATKRAVLMVGTADSLLPHSRAARDDLRAAGIDMIYEEIDGVGHMFPPDFEAPQTRAIRFILTGQRG
jgi:acetyl esterase/lipase